MVAAFNHEKNIIMKICELAHLLAAPYDVSMMRNEICLLSV